MHVLHDFGGADLVAGVPMGLVFGGSIWCRPLPRPRIMPPPDFGYFLPLLLYIVFAGFENCEVSGVEGNPTGGRGSRDCGVVVF